MLRKRTVIQLFNYSIIHLYNAEIGRVRRKILD
jgi:hypothetical protein